jgi:hypothetical protein
LTYPAKGRKLQTTPGLTKFYSQYLPVVTAQPGHRAEIAPSVFEANLAAVSEQAERENEWNTKGIGSNLNPMAYNKKKSEGIARMMAGFMKNTLNQIENESGQRMTDGLNSLLNQGERRGLSAMERKIAFTTEDDKVGEVVALSEEEIQKKREEEIASLQEELSKLRSNREELEKEIQTMNQTVSQIEVMLRDMSAETEKLEQKYRTTTVIFEDIKTGKTGERILQLQQINSQTAGRLVELAKEW